MTLTEHLAERIQTVANAAGRPGQEEAFTEAYATLLRELTTAMTAMKRLALMQGGWLQKQLVSEQGGKWN